jgi:hypothetical protein
MFILHSYMYRYGERTQNVGEIAGQTFSINIGDRESEVNQNKLQNYLSAKLGEKEIFLCDFSYGNFVEIIEARLTPVEHNYHLYVYVYRGQYEHTFSHVEYQFNLDERGNLLNIIGEKYIMYDEDELKTIVALVPFLALGFGMLFVNKKERRLTLMWYFRFAPKPHRLSKTFCPIRK